MALLTWNASYSVGVKTLDSQHTVLFGILNDLHDAMMKGQAQSITGTLLKKLVSYTQEHFSAEEAMLTKTNYPGLAEHKIKHNNLIKQVQEYVTQYEQGGGSLNIQLLNFLRDWLTNHIQKVDHEYTPWLNSHGVS